MRGWHWIITALLLGLAGCGAAGDAAKDAELADLVGFAADEPCVLTRREGRQLAGAYLRQPAPGVQSYALIFVAGKESRAGLPRKLVFEDRTLRRMRGNLAEGGLHGSSRSTATEEPGFGPAGRLPNVYKLGYRAVGVDYTGRLVVGPGPAGAEIPGSGSVSYGGRVVVEITAADGAPQVAEGRFALAAGYGTRRAVFTADLKGAGLPFTRLRWTNLYLCGARFVSSGQGQVMVSDGSGRFDLPFRTGRDPVPLSARFESALIAPEERPAPPEGVGGVFVVQSDLGTITGVFLADQPAAAGAP